jgi:hypothetical protein
MSTCGLPVFTVPGNTSARTGWLGQGHDSELQRALPTPSESRRRCGVDCLTCRRRAEHVKNRPNGRHLCGFLLTGLKAPEKQTPPQGRACERRVLRSSWFPAPAVPEKWPREYLLCRPRRAAPGKRDSCRVPTHSCLLNGFSSHQVIAVGTMPRRKCTRPVSLAGVCLRHVWMHCQTL